MFRLTAQAGTVIRWTIAPSSGPDVPSTDYHCQSRGQNDWNTPGAINSATTNAYPVGGA